MLSITFIKHHFLQTFHDGLIELDTSFHIAHECLGMILRFSFKVSVISLDRDTNEARDHQLHPHRISAALITFKSIALYDKLHQKVPDILRAQVQLSGMVTDSYLRPPSWTLNIAPLPTICCSFELASWLP